MIKTSLLGLMKTSLLGLLKTSLLETDQNQFNWEYARGLRFFLPLNHADLFLNPDNIHCIRKSISSLRQTAVGDGVV
jgi:hypothetical protein